MNEISYDELPSTLKAQIHKDLFISAYLLSNQKKIIIWKINTNINKQEELEFSTLENRLIPKNERIEGFPKEESKVLPDLGVEVSVSYELDKTTSVQHENYVIRAIGNNEVIAERTQVYFSPFKSSLNEIVEDALNEHRFQEAYSQWGEPDKINHWVEVLYRLRRQTAESGGNEDDVFSKELLDQISEADPQATTFFRGCLIKLAAIEQLNENELIASFQERTGLQV